MPVDKTKRRVQNISRSRKIHGVAGSRPVEMDTPVLSELDPAATVQISIYHPIVILEN